MSEHVKTSVSELSAKLLEGCKLVADSCPETNVPLVLTPDGRLYSVGNSSYYQRHGAALKKMAPDPPAQTPRATVNTRAAATPAADAEPPTRPIVDDGMGLSALVAQKLLEGFTLLSESCPDTNVPLVQDAAGHILSVGTGKWFTRRGASLEPAQPPSSPAATACASSPLPAAPPMANYDSIDFQPPLASCASSMAGSHAYADAPPHAGGGPARAQLPADLAVEVDAAMSVLGRKLALARESLERSTGLGEGVSSTVSLLKEIAQSLHALQSLS